MTSSAYGNEAVFDSTATLGPSVGDSTRAHSHLHDEKFNADYFRNSSMAGSRKDPSPEVDPDETLIIQLRPLWSSK